jgi:hypothetical protein
MSPAAPRRTSTRKLDGPTPPGATIVRLPGELTALPETAWADHVEYQRGEAEHAEH